MARIRLRTENIFSFWAIGSVVVLAALLVSFPGYAQQQPPTLSLPRVATLPTLDEVVARAMDADDPARVCGPLAPASGFVQRAPDDGRPASQPTLVCIGYDGDTLAVYFLAEDGRPDLVRARMARREQIDGDDSVSLYLDTYGDQRRAYVFTTNPFGVQWDAVYTEVDNFDATFDTVWASEGRRTPFGYAVRFAIPFRSLRFPAHGRPWRLILERDVQRGEAESSTWPRVSARIAGRLNQAALVEGIDAGTRTRHLQVIPYGTFRSFRILEPDAPGGPTFVTDPADPAVGADAKLVLGDNWVIDTTLNPDFSQVESDEPQVTVNRRFEVFFPERRPFFLENAATFRTPFNLLFTRRIADPSLGARVTGKLGPWSMGLLAIDDQAPGRRARPGEPLAGSRAFVGTLRVNRDVGSQSTAGAILVARELAGSFNRVAGVDGTFRLGSNWRSWGQLVRSDTRTLQGERLRDVAANAGFSRNGRHFNLSGGYTHIGRDFRAEAGFLPRTGFHATWSFFSYTFWPASGALQRWGPELLLRRVWDEDGNRLDIQAEPSLEWHFPGQTYFEVNYSAARERLLPRDFPALGGAPEDFDVSNWSLEIGTAFIDLLRLDGNLAWGRRVNFAPPAGRAPFALDWFEIRADLDLRPVRRLVIENTVLLTRLDEPITGSRVLTDRVLRTKWNLQMSRRLSLRAILQYRSTMTEPSLTRALPRRGLNADLLATYRVNPWTAVYLGFNGNARDVELVRDDLGTRIVRREGLHEDARQLFLKLSYLWRH